MGGKDKEFTITFAIVEVVSASYQSLFRIMVEATVPEEMWVSQWR